MKHQDGEELPREQQEILKTPNQLRTVYEHFYELNDMERNFVDLREYKVHNQPAEPSVSQSPQRSKTLNPRRNQNKIKTVYDRALPRIYMTDDAEFS